MNAHFKSHNEAHTGCFKIAEIVSVEIKLPKAIQDTRKINNCGINENTGELEGLESEIGMPYRVRRRANSGLYNSALYVPGRSLLCWKGSYSGAIEGRLSY